jgi:transketolase
MTIDEIKRFRQLGSARPPATRNTTSPGHRDHHRPARPGPRQLRRLRHRRSQARCRVRLRLVDHHTWVIAGDGCLMEGISQEAISLAGHLKLNKLVVIWDNNNGSPSTAPSPTPTRPTRSRASRPAAGTPSRSTGTTRRQVEKAPAAAKSSDKPTLIAAKTIIGYGAPTKAGTRTPCTAAPLGAEELAGAKPQLGIDYPAFEIPPHVAQRLARRRHPRPENAPRRLGRPPRRLKPNSAPNSSAAWPATCRPAGRAISAFKQKLAADKPKVATRKSSQMALEVINPSSCPRPSAAPPTSPARTSPTRPRPRPSPPRDFAGRYMRYGIREHEMAAAMNGIALHGGLIPYGGTFLVFTDYAAPGHPPLGASWAARHLCDDA